METYDNVIFKKGQKVLCIMDHVPEHNILHKGTDNIKFPIIGEIYTIRGLNGAGGVWLEEIVNTPTKFIQGGSGEMAFGTWCIEHVKPEKIKIKVKLPKYEEHLCG